MTTERPLTDADGKIVRVTYLESTVDDDGLPASIACPSEQALLLLPRHHTEEEGDDDDE